MILWLFLFLHLLILNSNSDEISTWELSIDTKTIIQNIPIPFYGFTFDYGGSSSWLNTGILTVNLSDPTIIALASELSPAILRVGGSAEDYVVYDISGECNYINQTVFCGTKGSKKSWTACLNMSRWQQINEFVYKTNLTLLYGLNACYGRKSSNTTMDFDNIDSLISFTANFSQSNTFNNLYSFEFGNEISGKIHSDVYANDYNYVYNLIQNRFKDSKHKPYLIGPDCEGHSDKYGWDQQMIQTLYSLNNNNQTLITEKLHRLTYHFYPKCVFMNNNTNNYNQTIFNMSCLETIVSYASNYSHLANISGTIAWMGEGAEYSHGGTENVTNCYADSFYFVYQLMELIKNGVKGTARSTFAGGYYEITDSHSTTNKFTPNPDYWMLYIFKTLIGDKMFQSKMKFVSGINDNYVRGYVVEGKHNGNYVVSLINFHLTYHAKIDIKIDNENQYLYQQYVLKGNGSNRLQTHSISVNGQLMQYKDGKFPTLIAQNITNIVDLPPVSIVFVVIMKLEDIR